MPGHAHLAVHGDGFGEQPAGLLAVSGFAPAEEHVGVPAADLGLADAVREVVRQPERAFPVLKWNLLKGILTVLAFASVLCLAPSAAHAKRTLPEYYVAFLDFLKSRRLRTVNL